MINFITGPMVIISVLIFIFGTIYQVFNLRKLAGESVSKNQEKGNFKGMGYEGLKFRLRMLKHTYIGFHKEKIVLSLIFHLFLILTPLLVPAHNIMLKQFAGFSFPAMPEPLVDIMTFSVIVFIFIFLIRRIAIARVRALSTFSDYLMLVLVLSPFLTGFLSCQQMADSKTIYLIHIISGELMLIALPFTKLVHMLFFFFGPMISIHRETFGNGARNLR